MPIKVSSSDLSETILLPSKNNLAILKERASEKFGKKIHRFVRQRDGIDVDDDEILEDLIGSEKPELHLIGLAKQEKYEASSETLRTKKEKIENSKKSLKSKFSHELAPSGDDSPSESVSSRRKETSKLKERTSSEENKKKPSSLARRYIYDESSDDADTEQFRLSNRRSVQRANNDSSDESDDHYKLSKKSEKKADNELSTVAFKKKQKELENKLKKEEEERAKYKERAAELERLSTSIKKEEERKEELKREFERKQRETEVTRVMRKTEIAALEHSVKKLELHKQKVVKVFAELLNAEKVDLCFVVDCTGSMSSYINEVKTTIHTVISKLSKRFKDFNLRMSFVGYRDHGDGTQRVTVFSFSENPDSFKSFVNGVEATGGADTCEDVFGGLEEVGKLDWSNMTRVLFHIADAPCHGSRFHSPSESDSYPDGDPRGLNITTLLNRLTDLNVSYYFAEINSTTRKMIEEFNLELNKLGRDEINAVNLTNVKDMMNTIVKSVTASIGQSKSMSMFVAGRSIKKTEKVDKAALNWSLSNFRKYKADLLITSFNGKIEEIKDKSLEFNCRTIEILLCPTPFTKGSIRYAYAAMIDSEKYVAKASMFTNAETNTMTYNKHLIESQIIARYLAQEFLKVCKSVRNIEFVEVSLVSIDGAYYSVEQYIPGTFEKWFNNVGEINEDIYACTIDAFSHWTYQITNEYLIVTDLQGFKVDSRQYILTDPAISCIDVERFSSTNLGKKGMKKYFETHRCNDVCKSLGLRRNKYQVLDDRPIGFGTKIRK